jgi:hypothetical protein
MTRRDNERGQALPIVALLLVVMLGLVGLAIDVGRLYIAKAELSRGVDAAVLAGVLELPDTTTAQSRARNYLHEHLPDANATFPGSTDTSMRVQGTLPVKLHFMGVFGFKTVTLKASASAGFGFVPSDTAMIIDATGSMGDPPCGPAQTESGCPIKEAKDAAAGFVGSLLGGKGTAQVAYAPYRGCYNPPLAVANCVPTSMIMDFTTSESSLRSAINNTMSTGGSGTNVCLGLNQALSFFKGAKAQAGKTVVRSTVILTDGDNTYNRVSFGNGAPPPACRPNTDPSQSDSSTASGCSGAQTRERELDVKTGAMAAQLEAAGVAVYVVAFGTCGSASNSVMTDSDCAKIGNADHDTTADRRLLKCMATSTDGTNDHYFEVASATDLPNVFQQIARAIGFRLTE